MPEFIGDIEITGSTDDYTVSLVAGTTYYFEVEGLATGQGTLPDSVVTLSLNGLEVGFDDDGGVGTNSRLVFTASETGNYTVTVGGFADVYTGTYKLSAFEDDYRGTVEGTGSFGSLKTGNSTTGAINYEGDHDLFGPALVAGLTYTLEVRAAGSGSGSLDDPFLTLRDESGTVITSDDDSGTGLFDSLITHTASYSGTHFLEVNAFFDFGTGSYTVVASAGAATVLADFVEAIGSHDAVDGLGGNDTILGGNGNDTLIGGTGNDLLRGQTGSDVLRGGAQADVLIGGTGNDQFDFDLVSDSSSGARDVIRAGDTATAFQGAGNAAGDLIDLSDIDANQLIGGNQAFIFGGVGSGNLSVVNSGNNSLVRGNTDGDASFELAILIEDGGVLASTYGGIDFIL